jgi:hypothetical protein
MRTKAIVAAAVIVVLAACSRKAVAVTTATRTPSSAKGAVEITDDEIERFIEWNRDWIGLARKHTDETQEVSNRVAEKYRQDFSRMSEDPELRATLDRQRAEMQEHMNRCPLDDAQIQAVKAVYEGIVPQRNEQALSNARRKYGNKFVDRVVAHEREISANYR